ncbi:hypothetical protein [Psychrobacter sp. Sarcosine-3u-12]|uniref:hypothetical protein n=1 Tax=Psychrobacter sp. Sarcosine-3u-12 TaxID=2058325 RepID=UPI000C329BF2|nr:hypothetical protein [Psychrobacter sp. Sarcosine-3u-12]PKG36538.1 hypothetical protein CXF65_01650 [Psychrobacter sp. Sarcosine-3u-12]
MRIIELLPLALETNVVGQRRSCIIKEVMNSRKNTNKKLWFLYPNELPMPADSDCDSYLLATLLPAMQMKADIIVHGSVSQELLANLTELQYVWHKWLPEEFFLVDIKVDSVRENETRAEGTIAAFSGGADAQFTAYRHAKGIAGYSTQDIRAGVFVHGFDIPLADTQGFLGAAKMAAEVLESIDLTLFTVKTNIREVWNVNWELYCGTALASTLCGFNKYVGVGLLGSGESYDELVTPWGSHPITDPLLSSSTFKVIHDGAGFNRSEKIKAISEWPLGIKNLRVCWAGGNHERNCGYCEKCVRTRLNFLLSGVTDPACFTSSLKPSIFDSVVLRSEAARSEWKLIRSEMIETGRGLEWLPQVDQVLKRKSSPRFGRLLPPSSKRRELVKKILAKK